MKIKLGNIRDRFNLFIRGEENEYIGPPCSLNDLVESGFTYVKAEKYIPDLIESIRKSDINKMTVLTTRKIADTIMSELEFPINYIYSKNPRLDYAKIVNSLEEYIDTPPIGIHNSALIDDGVVIGNNPSVGPGVFIGPNTKIGDNIIIHPNVTIYGETTIGNNVEIHSGTVMGKPGFGYEWDEDSDQWVKFPQIGSIEIGDNVEIGSCTCIDKGALEPTIIGNGSKIDNLVHVAHGVKIGKNVLIIALAELSGSVKIGDKTWVAPNVCMREGIKIGSNSTLGLGAVVIKDVPDNSVIVGNPGMPLDEFSTINRHHKKLIRE